MQKEQCHTSFRFSVPSPELCDARDTVATSYWGETDLAPDQRDGVVMEETWAEGTGKPSEASEGFLQAGQVGRQGRLPRKAEDSELRPHGD